MLLDKRLIIDPSVRFSYYASIPAMVPEPRIGVKFNVTDRVRLKGSSGYYVQNFISTKSDRDVVNLFTGFLSSPEGELEDTEGEVVANSLQSAVHFIGGIEVDVAKRLTVNVEGYLKKFTQLLDLNRNKTFPSDPDWVIETGEASGVDFLTQYDSKHWSLWLAYSLGFNTRDDGTITYKPHFDRRHNLNFLTTYTFGGDLTWEASVRWNFGSGFPFTKTQGFYEMLNFLGGVDADFLNQNGTMGVVYDDEYNGGRLPYYHRLDIGLRKSFAFGDHTSLDLNASVTNVYDRENIFYFDRLRYERINQLPIIPSIGATFKF